MVVFFILKFELVYEYQNDLKKYVSIQIEEVIS